MQVILVGGNVLSFSGELIEALIELDRAVNILEGNLGPEGGQESLYIYCSVNNEGVFEVSHYFIVHILPEDKEIGYIFMGDINDLLDL